MYLPLQIELVVLLIVCSAFFSCSETAFFSLTRAELHKIKHSKHAYARHVVRLLQSSRDFLITILLGNEIINIGLSIVIAELVHTLVGPISWQTSTLISVCIATPVIVIFGDLIPKNLAVRNARRLVRILVFPMVIFSKITGPLRKPLIRLTDVIIGFFGGDPKSARSMIMEEEFRELVDMGLNEGVLEEGESELIHRLFELGNKRVRDIMTPVSQMFGLALSKSIEDALPEIRSAQFNRIPVYDQSQDDIVGVVHARDVVRVFRDSKRGHSQDLETIIRPAHFVQEDMTIEDVLTDLQKLKTHLAVVLNKKRKVVGIVTMDDIFQLLFTHKITRVKNKVEGAVS